MRVLAGWLALVSSVAAGVHVRREQVRHDRSHAAQMAALRRACTRARSPRLYR